MGVLLDDSGDANEIDDYQIEDDANEIDYYQIEDDANEIRDDYCDASETVYRYDDYEIEE